MLGFGGLVPQPGWTEILVALSLLSLHMTPVDLGVSFSLLMLHISSRLLKFAPFYVHSLCSAKLHGGLYFWPQ